MEENECPQHNFKHIGLLDVFPKCLPIEESIILLDSNHNKNNEHKFIQFFKKCISELPGPICVVRRAIFHERNNKKEHLYIVEDFNELLNIILSIAREECFYNIFFIEMKTVIIGNFELSWPIYSNAENFDLFIESAKEVNLYIRTE